MLIRALCSAVACAAGVAALSASSACATPIFYDNFEPWWVSGWGKCPGSSAQLEMSGSQDGGRPCHDGTHAVLAQPNWRWSYTGCHALPTSYAGEVYLSVWVYDSANIPPGMPGPPDNPNWSAEHVPNARIRIEDSAGYDWLHLACIGRNKAAYQAQWAENIYFSVDIAYEGVRLLTGPPNSVVAARREHGWRKWMVRVKPYTGGQGDVEFYLDGQLVYSGYRNGGPTGAPGMDKIGLGSNTWTGEWYWYDEVEVDYWPNAVQVGSIQEALTNPDGTWVEVPNLTVARCHADSIEVCDIRGDRISVYPARFEAPDDVVTVLGRVATSGMERFIDSLVVDRTSVQPPVTLASISQARDLPDGTRVRLPSRIVIASRGSERYIEEANRTCGLKVRNIYEPAIGQMVTVEGQMMTVGPEKLLEAEKVTLGTTGNALPKPVAVPNRSLYEGGVIPSGMLVVTTGRVVNRPGSGTWYPAWFEIRDGSMPEDALPVRVVLPDYRVCPNIGDYVWVRGAAGWLVESVGSRPEIVTRYTSDINTL